MLTAELRSKILYLGKVICHLILHLREMEIFQHVRYGIFQEDYSLYQAFNVQLV